MAQVTNSKSAESSDEIEDGPREINHHSSHCSLQRGEYIGGMEVTKRLGRGRFTTVWAARQIHATYVIPSSGIYSKTRHDTESVAIKMYRTGHSIEKYFINEVRIFNKLRTGHIIAPDSVEAGAHIDHTNIQHDNDDKTVIQAGAQHVISFLGAFAHVDIDRKDGTPCIYPYILFTDAGDSLSALQRFCKHKYDGGIPAPVVKKIMKQIFAGLAYVHSCGIIHTDIKPSNILLNTSVTTLTDSTLRISIADFGSSSTVDHIFSRSVGTTPYIAPELLIEMPFGPPMDIWAACTMCYELITGDLLFDVYEECDAIYGSDVDGEAVEDLGLMHTSEHTSGTCSDSKEAKNIDCTCCEPQLEGTHEATATTHSNEEAHNSYRSDSTDGDSSGSEASIEQEKINYRHLLLMIKMLGYPPEKLTANARVYFNIYNKLYNHPDITPIGITDMLMLNYDMDKTTCIELEDFLLQGLRYLPSERFTALQAYSHSWVNN